MTANKRTVRVLTCAAAGFAVLGAVAACGATKPSAAALPASSPAAAGGAAGNRQAPGTFGVIAAATPGSLEVQDPNTGQTTVTYTSTTAFTQQKAVTLAAVTSGECVVATDAAATRPTSTPSASATAAPTATPSSAPGSPLAITATTVTISPPVAGSCTSGLGTGATPTRRPPSGTATGGPQGSRTPGTRLPGFGGFVTGQVTAVAGTTIEVKARDRQSAQQVTDTVTVTAATSYLETMPATAAAATVGMCAQATGPADSSGAVAATRVQISSPVNGSCTAGFAGRGGFGRRAGSATASTGG
jgi:hypothetical protein